MTSHFFSGIRITNLGQGKAIIEKIPIFLNQHDTHVFFFIKWEEVAQSGKGSFFSALNSCDFVVY